MKEKVTRKLWNGMELVKVSDVPGFGHWLYGQTCPMVLDDPEPTNWAYLGDYIRFIKKLPVID